MKFLLIIFLCLTTAMPAAPEKKPVVKKTVKKGSAYQIFPSPFLIIS